MSDNPSDYLRLMANPYRLKALNEAPPKDTNLLGNTISGILHSEFQDIYVNSYLIDRIKQVIHNEVHDYLIETTVNDLVSSVTEQSIRDALQDSESRNPK